MVAPSTCIASLHSRNEQIRNYLGDDLTSRDNRKVRDLCLKIIRHHSIEVINELLTGTYAAIDTEYRFDPNNKTKPYTIFAVAIVDSLGNIKIRHESYNFGNPNPEKEIVEWTMQEILKYRLTIGWYSKGVRLQNKDTGTFSGKDSDLKIIDDACRYYNIPSMIGFDKRGIPYVRGYDYHLSVRNLPFLINLIGTIISTFTKYTRNQ